MKLAVIGDSHSRLFAGVSGIGVWHVGPALAWSLGDPTSATGGGRKTLAALGNLSPETWALLSYGEIDMRCHALKHGGARPCAERYLDFVRGARTIHNRIALWAPPATQPATVPNEELYPALGTVAERNAATVQFTAALAESEIPVISIFDLMVNERGGTRPEALDPDGRHVNRNLLPDALQRIVSRLALELPPPGPTAG